MKRSSKKSCMKAARKVCTALSATTLAKRKKLVLKNRKPFTKFLSAMMMGSKLLKMRRKTYRRKRSHKSRKHIGGGRLLRLAWKSQRKYKCKRTNKRGKRVLIRPRLSAFKSGKKVRGCRNARRRYKRKGAKRTRKGKRVSHAKRMNWHLIN